MKLRTIVIIYIFIFGSLFGQNIIFEDGFESGSLDSTANGWWTTESSDSTGFVSVVTDYNNKPANHSGSYGVAIGKPNNTNNFITNSLDLHLDLSGEEDVELSFWIKGYFGYPHPEDGISFSDDGGLNFKIIYTFLDSWENNIYGQLPPIDIDELAKANGLSLTDKFVIRFQQYGNRSFQYDSYFIDDVKVTQSVIEYATLPFFDDFESGALSNSWKWADPTFPTLTTKEKTVSPGGIVTVGLEVQGKAIAYKGSFGLAMGRSSIAELTTNAIDLHLNLSDKEQVELSFWIKKNGDDQHPQDGIWFSDDGGENFKVVYQFDLDSWRDREYGQLPPIDIDELVNKNGLSLTDNFVIRFQQYGDRDFRYNGLFIDNVKIIQSVVEYATLPFLDGFESGTLSNAWKWVDPTFPALTTKSPTEAITVLPGGFVKVTQEIDNSSIAYDGSFGLAMGRGSRGEFTTNAIELNLDLSKHENIVLTFWIKDYFDDTQPYDGIWFSDNGGQNFSPASAYHFQPSDWTNEYHAVIVNVDSIINARNDLSFSNQFIFRFQQYGDFDFGNDGISFDNFEIFGDKITDVETNKLKLPTSFILEQNYPNPFNPSTTISYSLPKEVTVNITVYDLFGREVAVLVNKEKKSAGTYQVTFNSTNLASGIYMYRLETENYTATKKMLLVQ